MPRTTSWHLSSDTASPALARAAARRFLSECGYRCCDESAAELLVSELVTNAVEHTLADGQGLDVTLELLTDRLRITVADQDPVLPVLRDPGPESERGRGLRIVDSLAMTWGWERRPDRGKSVWCELRAVRWGCRRGPRLDAVHATAGDSRAGDHRVPLGPAVDPDQLTRLFDDVVANVRRAYVGRESTVRLALCCLMAEGHLLVEDYPGVGKTTLAKALAQSLGLDFGRVQFTADLLPADVTGAVVIDRETKLLGFRPGPVFTNVLLADELNRASPKAQSALLEAMEERQVSVDGTTHALPRPFMVVATQNPYDSAGTFPLPHSQLDRFLLRLDVGYPDRALEDELLAEAAVRPQPEELPVVAGPTFVSSFGARVHDAHVAAPVRGYILDLVNATRSHADLAVGASPRAALSVQRAAAAVAVAGGRDYVIPDDVKTVAEPALGHRIVVHPVAAVSAAMVVGEILERLPVPVVGSVG